MKKRALEVEKLGTTADLWSPARARSLHGPSKSSASVRSALCGTRVWPPRLRGPSANGVEAGKNHLHPRFFSHFLHDQFQTVVFFYWQRSRLGTCLIYFSSAAPGPNAAEQEPAGSENQTAACRQVVNFWGLLLSTPNLSWKNTTSAFSYSRWAVAQNVVSTSGDQMFSVPSSPLVGREHVPCAAGLRSPATLRSSSWCLVCFLLPLASN